MSDSKSKAPRWIIIATAVLGLIAAAGVVATRYYEIRKARAEAALAEAKSSNSQTSAPSSSDDQSQSSKPKTDSVNQPTVTNKHHAPPAKSRVKVETSHGAFTIELHHQIAPKTVDAFLSLVKSKSFNGTRLVSATIGNRSSIDKEKKAADIPMAANVRFSPPQPFRWLDSIPTDLFARRGDLCLDQRYGENDSRLVITQVQGSFPGRFTFGRVVEGWDTVDKLCDGIWNQKNGDRLPSLFLETTEVKIKSIQELPVQ